MNQQGPDIPNDKDNQFLTLGKLMSKETVATLASAIEQNGIYMWDPFGRFVLADKEGKARALDLLKIHYNWECTPIDEENCTGTDILSPLDKWADETDSPYDKFGWTAKMVPDFDKILGALIDAKEGKTQNEKPWLIPNPNDPATNQSWYTAARYFARQLVVEDSTLLIKRPLLACKVSESLENVGICKRGGKKKFASGTVLKAFTNVVLG